MPPVKPLSAPGAASQVATLVAPTSVPRAVRRSTSSPIGAPSARALAEHNPARGTLLAAFGLLILLLGSGCTSGGPPRDGGGEGEGGDFTKAQLERLERLDEALRRLPPPEDPASLRVRLAFDDAADLDLYVTDPLQETVYFANSPTRSGGRLTSDLRCGSPAPRVESVDFPTPLSGRYRVGVDFPERCEESELPRSQRRQGVFVVRVDRPRAHGDERAQLERGVSELGRFEVIVLEFDVGPEAVVPVP